MHVADRCWVLMLMSPVLCHPMQGPSALTLDLVNVVRRMKLLGFNAIRLPFSFTGASSPLPL